MDKDQQGILSKGDMELIKASFSGDGEKLLYAVRDIFLQFPLHATGLLGRLQPETLAVMKKFIFPVPDPDIPIKSQADLYFSLDKIKEIPPEVAFLHIRAMDKMVDYLEQRFDFLTPGSTMKGEEIMLMDLKSRESKTDEERFVDLIAYQSIVAYVETSLDRLRVIANTKEETEEEKEARLKANSNK